GGGVPELPREDGIWGRAVKGDGEYQDFTKGSYRGEEFLIFNSWDRPRSRRSNSTCRSRRFASCFWPRVLRKYRSLLLWVSPSRSIRLMWRSLMTLPRRLLSSLAGRWPKSRWCTRCWGLM